jgi:hypothetical protein
MCSVPEVCGRIHSAIRSLYVRKCPSSSFLLISTSRPLPWPRFRMPQRPLHRLGVPLQRRQAFTSHTHGRVFTPLLGHRDESSDHRKLLCVTYVKGNSRLPTPRLCCTSYCVRGIECDRKLPLGMSWCVHDLNMISPSLQRYIRGSGLAYGAYVSIDTEAGFLSFSLYRVGTEAPESNFIDTMT